MAVSKTKLHQLRNEVIEACFEALKGEPITDAAGNVILFEGKPLMRRPQAATLNVIRQLLKDNGIDRDPLEAPPAKTVTDGLPFADELPQFSPQAQAPSLPDFTNGEE